MIKQATQAVDDGQVETEAASLAVHTIELTEYIVLLILGNAGPAVP
jgi:hypothetical protein